MAVEQYDIIIYGSATMALNDVTTQIGGAVDESIKVSFGDMTTTHTVEIVAEGADTAEITIYGREADGSLSSEAETLNGTTPVPTTLEFERLLRAVKTAGGAETCCVMNTTNVVSDTAQSGGANYLELHAGASASDEFYTGMVLRMTGGDGINQIREIVQYDGTTKFAYVRTWETTPSTSLTFEIADGMVFEFASGTIGTEIMDVRRPFYNAAAEPVSGSERTYFEKVFIHNLNATTALTTATIDEVDEGLYTSVAFDLESTLDGSDDNGAGNNRQTEGDLSTYTFDSAEKNVANSQNLSATAAQGVWVELTLAAGASATNSFYKLLTSGQST